MITKLSLIFYEFLTFVGFCHCKTLGKHYHELKTYVCKSQCLGKVIIIDVMLVIQQFININMHDGIQYNNIYLNNKKCTQLYHSTI
jgi:hypothetical protein